MVGFRNYPPTFGQLESGQIVDEDHVIDADPHLREGLSCRCEIQLKDLILEGVSGIVEGLNPKLIRVKLEAYTDRVVAKPEKAGKAVKEAGKPVAPGRGDEKPAPARV